MKCYLMQRPKHRASTEDKKKVEKIVNEYIGLSLVVGHKKALEILKENRKNESEVSE